MSYIIMWLNFSIWNNFHELGSTLQWSWWMFNASKNIPLIELQEAGLNWFLGWAQIFKLIKSHYWFPRMLQVLLLKKSQAKHNGPLRGFLRNEPDELGKDPGNRPIREQGESWGLPWQVAWPWQFEADWPQLQEARPHWRSLWLHLNKWETDYF